MESVDYELAITQDECDGVVLLPGLEGFAVSLRCTEDQMLCDEGCRNFDIDEDHCGEMRSVLPDDVRQRHVQLSCCRISRKKATGRVVLGALRGRDHAELC